MEMEIKNNTFYVLEASEDKRICDNASAAIESLKVLVGKKKDLNPEKVNIFEVNTAKEKWEIKAVPWSRIAIELLKAKSKES